MGLLDEIFAQEGRSDTSPYRGSASRVPQTTGKTTSKRGGLSSITNEYAKRKKEQDKKAADATALTGEVITSIRLPTGDKIPVQAPSGSPYLVRKPGSSTILRDPTSGEELVPDVKSKTGLTSVTAAKEVADEAKADAVATKLAERSRVRQAQTYDRALKSVASDKKEAQRLANADRANEYLAQGRKFFNDRQTGEPIPLQSDEEFQLEQQTKLTEAAEKSRAKQLKRKVENLDLDAETLKLERKPPTATEYEKLKKERDADLETIRFQGVTPDETGLAALEKDPVTAQLATGFRDKQQRLKDADEVQARLDEIARRKIDIQRQLNNPDQWEAEEMDRISTAPDADLDERMKIDAEVIKDLDRTIEAEATPIFTRQNELEAENKAAFEALNAATGAGSGADRIQAAKRYALAQAKLANWNAESGEAKAGLEESYKLRNQRVATHNAAQKTRQDKAINARKEAIAGLATTPALAPVAAKVQALDEEEAKRLADIETNVPEEQRETAREAAIKDITAKRAEVDTELQQKTAEVQANLEKLYQEHKNSDFKLTYTKQSQTTRPDLPPLSEALDTEIQQLGLNPEQAKEFIATRAALDWSAPMKLDESGKGDFSEEYRKLPNGDISVSPRFYLDEEEYQKAVERADASPEAKAQAIEMRRELAMPYAVEALQTIEKDMQLAEWIEKNTSGNPLERIEQFNEEFKKGGALEAAYTRFRSGAGGLASSALGAIAFATGSEDATNAAQYFKDHSAAYEMAGAAAGKGTNAVGRFASKVIGAAPSVIPAVVTGLATGGVGLGTTAAVNASALVSGLQSLGGTYVDAYATYKDQGLSDSEARAKAIAPAIASGVITGLVTRAGGATGVESLFRKGETEIVKQGIKAAVMRVLPDASKEALEELSDQTLQSMVQKLSFNPDKTLKEALDESLEAGLIGFALGGAITAGRGNNGPTEAEPLPSDPAPEIPDAPVSTEPLPEIQASLDSVISNFKPANTDPMPDAIRAVAKTRGTAKTSQDAARGLMAVAQGANLDAMPAAQLEALGLTRTAKGVEAKDKKVSPLVDVVKGKPVIRDEAIEWLEQNGLDLLRNQIGKTETERLAEVNAPEPVPAKAETKPAKKPKAQSAAKPGQAEASKPVAQEATTAPVEPMPAAPEAQTSARPELGKAPPAQRKAIGKGVNGRSYAEFAAPEDADAFTYAGNLKEPRNEADSAKKRRLGRAAESIKRVEMATGIPAQELRPLMTEYSQVVRDLAKSTPDGESFQAPTFAEFVTSKTLPPAGEAQEEGSQGVPSKPEEGSISPVTDESVTPTPQESSPVIENENQGSVSEKAASMLGISKTGQLVKGGYVNQRSQGIEPNGVKSERALTKTEQKRFVAAAKAMVDTLSKAAKIKGINIIITDDPDVESAQADQSGNIIINPRNSALNIATNAKNVEGTPKDLVVHELIHELAARRIVGRDYANLWQSLPEATQKASLDEYFRNAGDGPRPAISDQAAGAEFFAQIIEARLKGELASQVWDSPSLTKKVLKMVREYIAALRDLVKLIPDVEMRNAVKRVADDVEIDVRSALKEAGIEDEFLGAPPVKKTKARKPKKQTDAPETLSAPPVSSVQDKAYLKAVADGDMETAQKMVDEAAKKAGYGKPRPVENEALLETPLYWRLQHQGWQLNPDFKSTNQNDSSEAEAGLSVWGSLRELINNQSGGLASYPRGAVEIVAIHGKQVGTGLDGESVIKPSAEAARFFHPSLRSYIDSDTLYSATEMSENAGDIDTINEFLDEPWGWTRVSEMGMEFDPVTRDAAGNVTPLSQRFTPESDSILYAPSPPPAPNPSEPSPVSPSSSKSAATPAEDQAGVRSALDDMEASSTEADKRADAELRQDPEVIRALADQRSKQGDGKKGGNPKLANIGTTDLGRDYYAAQSMAQAMNGAEVSKRADVFDFARKELEKDPAGQEKRLFEMMEEGTGFNEEDTAIAALLHRKMERDFAIDRNNKELEKRFVKLGYYFRQIRAEAGRNLGIIQDPKMTPIERIRESISAVNGPPAKWRNKILAAWAPKAKLREIARLEKEVSKLEGDAKAFAERELAAAKALQDKDEVLADYIAENKRLQDEVLKRMNLSEDDVMLDPEDRYALRDAVLESPGVKAAMESYSAEQKAAVNLAINGYADEVIAKRTGFKAEEVAKIAENFRQNVLKPAIAAEVKKGRTFKSLLADGYRKLKGLLSAPKVDQFGNLAASGDINAVNAAAIEAEINRILDFIQQPARKRNRPGSLVAKVVQLKNGQKVRMFIPFDPDDARAFYRYAREISTRDASTFDKVYEYWINGILSGPQTQVANIAGNTAQIAWNYTFQRTAEALLNIAYRNPKSARLGEFPHVFKAFFKSFGEARNQAMLAWDTEADNLRNQYLDEPLTADFKDANLDKVGGQRSSIQGTKGRIIRIPGRALRFFDSLFKTAVLHAEATAIAYREGRANGYKGAALDSFMTTRLQQRGSNVWSEAMAVGDELLFQDENWATNMVEDFVKSRSRISKLEKEVADAEAAGDTEKVAKLRKSMASAKFVASLLRFLFPFTRTPTNILRIGVRKAGGAAVAGLFNAANGLYQMRNGKPFTESYTKAAQIKDLSETFLAATAWAMLAGMAEGDDDDDKKSILIIGNRPYGAASAGEKAEVMRKYGGTQVIIIRNPITGQESFRFNYGRYEPFATATGIMVDMFREFKQAKKNGNEVVATDLAGQMVAHLFAQVESKSFLQGLAGIARAMEQYREARADPGGAIAKSLIAGIVPNLVRQSMRNMDDYQREYKSAGWMHEAAPTGDFAEPQIGPGGEPVKKGGSPLSRLLFQVPNAPSKVTAEKFVQDYNLRHPDNRVERAPLGKTQYYAYTPNGKTKIPVETAQDKRLLQELHEKYYEQDIAAVIAQNPLFRLKEPPASVVDDIKDVNADALKKARKAFSFSKSMQSISKAAK